jgi:methylmalonyl-CoA carboxyltransferase large subunit
MKPETNGLADVLKALASIQDELAALGRRVASLEAAAQAQSAAPPTPFPASTRSAAPPADAPLSDEIVMVLGAAVAAFLGKKAHIRRIQLIGSNAWAQQGRVTIQASHALSTSRSQP